MAVAISRGLRYWYCISRYEKRERGAGYETLVAMADYFQVSLDYLLGRTDQPDMKG